MIDVNKYTECTGVLVDKLEDNTVAIIIVEDKLIHALNYYNNRFIGIKLYKESGPINDLQNILNKIEESFKRYKEEWEAASS